MKSGIFLTTGALAIACAIAVPASAATFLFDLSGSRNASFTLQGDPVVPDRINNQPILSGSQIFFDNVAGTFNGVAGTGNINFGSGPILASLNIGAPGLGFTQFGGVSLFSFVGGQPVFNTGTFDLFGIVVGRSTLTITEVLDNGGIGSTVPEPASWLMMVLGFGLVGGMLRSTKTHERRTSITA
jgi:hypothetical protein